MASTRFEPFELLCCLCVRVYDNALGCTVYTCATPTSECPWQMKTKLDLVVMKLGHALSMTQFKGTFLSLSSILFFYFFVPRVQQLMFLNSLGRQTSLYNRRG
jgi:hypothetical protein